jgi:hypothetical protein
MKIFSGGVVMTRSICRIDKNNIKIYTLVTVLITSLWRLSEWWIANGINNHRSQRYTTPSTQPTQPPTEAFRDHGSHPPLSIMDSVEYDVGHVALVGLTGFDNSPEKRRPQQTQLD